MKARPTRHWRTRLLTLLAGLAALAAGAAPASAAPGFGSPTVAPPTIGQEAATTYKQRGMDVVGFDAEVAAANGYKIVTYADGSQQSVPVDPADKTKEGSPIVSPGVMPQVVQETVHGNCGYSFIEGNQVGAHKIWLRSGFGLSKGPPAVSYRWTIELQDKYGFSYQGSRGSLALRETWSKTWDNLNQYGWSSHDVLRSSYALRANGSICTSGGPGIFWYVHY